MKFAAIDIGSNAVRLIFINVYETPTGPQFVKDAMYRVALRLGEEAFLKGKISEKKTEELLSTMKAFKHLIDVHKPVQIMACATSAMRDAKNAKEIVAKVLKKTGIDIKIITGQKEAELILSNHVEKLQLEENKNYLYIDVGGGSTELILLSKGKLVDKWSFNIGTLRMTLGKIKEKHWKELDVWVDHFKGKYQPLLGIGSGGNINTIQKHFVKRKDNEVHLSDLQFTYDKLESMTIDERILKYGFRPDRADVIVPATTIFMHIMQRLSIETLFVPKVGLGDGMIHEMYEKMTKVKRKKR
ncbi:MAG: exopolyphosphatase [Chitinophagales bacterium]|nr:exopolyphosphatase [Saprospirales bacterium]MBK8350390.1 exopolyphosphatase [Saprospirales bacterium]MBP6659244.1 exopolyphosphatase [Chitinophagales bacterium]